VGAIIVAVQFTEWYPDYGAARARENAGVSGEPAPPVAKLLVPLAGYLTPVGISHQLSRARSQARAGAAAAAPSRL
jgi:hypothetical protein